MWINWISLRLTQLPPVRWMETLAANRITVSFDITGLSIPSGAGFLIAGMILIATGADDGLAIDDFSIEATTPGPDPPS